MENVFWNIEKVLPIGIEVRSNVGGRNEQQDYAYISSLEKYLICTLCDGMGGMEYGSLASKIAAKTINSHLSCPQKGEDGASFTFRKCSKVHFDMLIERCMCRRRIAGQQR